MPSKDPEARRAAVRRAYHKNREYYIAKVRERKRTAYAGVCRHCGGPTVGPTKGKAPDSCGKPECRSAEKKGDYRYVEWGILGKKVEMTKRSWASPSYTRKKQVGLDEILSEIEAGKIGKRRK